MGKLFRKTVLRIDMEECWDFFSSPANLARITPDEMDFVITEYDGKRMYEGQLISYTVKPLFGFKVKWTTEITSVTDYIEFVDRQLEGPYKIWHHRHQFKQVDGGVEMIDMVHYALPFGILGKIAEKLIVKKKVKAIFDYREKVISDLFPANKEKKEEYSLES
jgi:ligand-binding SRPBCC domain-containing protein